MMYTLKPITKDFTDQEWKDYYEFRKICAEKGAPLNFISWENLKLRALDAINDGLCSYIVWKNNEPFGHFLFDTIYKDNSAKKHLHFLNNMVQSRLDKTLLKLIFKTALNFDAALNFILIESKNGANDFLEDEFNAEIGDESTYSELKINDAFTNVINGWLLEGQNKFSHLKLKFYDELPENLIDEYANVITSLLNDMPYNKELREFKFRPETLRSRQRLAKDNNRCTYRYAVFNEANQLVAMTNVMVNKNNSKVMHQVMTGALLPYRGIGIGKWLKAAMYKKLTSDFPELEVIETDANPANKASIKLSEKMGFVKVGNLKKLIVRKEIITEFLEREYN